jgi:glycosyltransferase involved in cell wall biosynthesis
MSPGAFLVPAGVQDSRHPSGGNRYDVELVGALRLAGWRIRMVEVDRDGTDIDSVLADLPEHEPVLLDGLLLERGIDRPPLAARRLLPLLHMPPSDDGAFELLHRVDSVVTTSAWTAERVRGRLPASTPIVVALPGVRPTRLVGTSPTGRRLRCVGALLPHKGQDVLLAALGRIRSLEWRCELVGPSDVDPAFTRRLLALAADVGIAERVLITGPRHANPVDGLYSGADLVVLPSRTESYGMAVAEALACGVPVIAADTGGVREAIEPAAGLLVPPGDPAGLAAALGAWLSRTELRRRLTAAARLASAHRRSWSSAAGVVADLLAAAPARRNDVGVPPRWR